MGHSNFSVAGADDRSDAFGVHVALLLAGSLGMASIHQAIRAFNHKLICGEENGQVDTQCKILLF